MFRPWHAVDQEALAVQRPYFQRAEQRPTADIVPTVATATHRLGNTVVAEHVAEILSGVLAATIAVEDLPAVPGRVALEPRPTQRIDGNVAGRAITHRSTWLRPSLASCTASCLNFDMWWTRVVLVMSFSLPKSNHAARGTFSEGKVTRTFYHYSNWICAPNTASSSKQNHLIKKAANVAIGG